MKEFFRIIDYYFVVVLEIAVFGDRTDCIVLLLSTFQSFHDSFVELVDHFVSTAQHDLRMEICIVGVDSVSVDLSDNIMNQVFLRNLHYLLIKLFLHKSSRPYLHEPYFEVFVFCPGSHIGPKLHSLEVVEEDLFCEQRRLRNKDL